MHNTKIEWCDSTWNPVTGCLHGCEYCYARKIAKRFGGWNFTPGMIAANVAEDKTYIHPTKKYYGEIKETKYGKIAEIIDPFLKGNGSKAPYPFGFDPTFHRYRLNELAKWQKPRTIFVCSMADLFGDWIPDEWIETVFEACEKAPQHRYLFLTKNPKRYVELYEADKLPLEKNMWYGASVTTPEQVEKIAKRFAKLPCSPKQANTFLSVEPIFFDIAKHNAWELFCRGYYADWIIVGAETGNRKDKVIPQKAWIRNIVVDCDYNDIPVFMKDSLIPIIGEKNMRREFPMAELTWKIGVK